MRIDDGSVTAVGVVHRLLAPRSPIATWYNFRRDSSSSAILQLNGGGAQNLSSGEPLSAGIGRIVVAAMAMLTVTATCTTVGNCGGAAGSIVSFNENIIRGGLNFKFGAW